MPTASRFIPVIILATALCASASTDITNLRCESKTNPLGIDVPHPFLSWQMRSDQRAQSQSAYQVIVTNDGQPLWDSGKVQSDQSTSIPYAGHPLTSGEICRWKVLVWNQDGQQFTSDNATWEMGLLQPSDWQARWIDSPAAQIVPPIIAPTTAPTTTKTKPVAPFTAPPLFRKSLTITKPITRARLYATALGLYQCSLNGHHLGDAVLSPDWTDYHKRVEYQTFDVTTLLQQGDNVLEAIVADGWYSGKVGWLAGHVYGARPAFLAQLMIDYADGTHDMIATDESWTTSPSPILRADLMDGEDYDARRQASDWVPAALSSQTDHPLLQAAIAPPVRQLRELPAKAITEPAPGKFTFDLGQNMVGVARLKVTGPAGTKITLRFAEMLNPDGTIYTDNLRAARATDSYILKGGGEETWQPRFTFHGFRYVEVTGYPGKPSLDAITGIVIGSDNPPAGTWECSNPILNQLQSNITWGQRGNYVSIPTDCPQRDERLGWMGDAQVFIRTATFNADVHEFFNNWLLDVMDAQRTDGAYTDVSPRVAAGSGVAAWADAGVICPWTIYQVYHDARLLNRQYDSMAKYIEYLKKNSDGLIRPAKGYGDWLSIAADTPKDVLATAYFAYSVQLMSKIATVLNKDEDAAKYQQLFTDIRKAFNDKFVAADGKILGDTQTCYLLALKFDLLDESKRPDAARRLVADIKEKNWHLSTGFVGVSYLLPILTEYGYTDVAYRLLMQDTFPSWLFSVKHGARRRSGNGGMDGRRTRDFKRHG